MLRFEYICSIQVIPKLNRLPFSKGATAPVGMRLLAIATNRNDR